MIENYRWSTADQHLRHSDPIIGSLSEQFGPCTLAPRSDYYRVLCQSIIGQQLSSKAAATIFQRFCCFFDQQLTATKLLQAPSEDLRTIGLSRQKIAYLQDLAQRYQQNFYTFSDYANQSSTTITTELTATKGIGLWTAQMFLMFAINHPDILPLGDLGIGKAVQQHYQLASRPNQQQLTAIAEPWQPFRTIACWYLWRSTDDEASNW